MSSVLVVDDSLTVRMDIADAFKEEGLRVVLSDSLASAREALRREQPALVILDVLLPDGDGTDLLRELRSMPATERLPVVLLSTEAEVADRIRGLTLGADEYVGKPYDPANLVARAKGLVAAYADAQAVRTSPTVLVIDDSLTFREELRELFAGAGYRVYTANTGEEGLRTAASVRPDAIIVDRLLPGIDGATVVRHVRLDAALRRTPCLLLTPSGDRDEELAALDAGADAFVRKEEDPERILLRLAAVLRHSGGPSAISDAPSVLAPKRVLAVDDSVTFLNALGDQLRGEGFDVVLASSGEEALRLLEVQPVDAILLDLLMPGIGGQETCARIKLSPTLRDIPLVILTSLDRSPEMVRAMNAGADDFITKSGDFEVLRARLRAQLRRKQFEDENRAFREQLLQRELDASEARAAAALAETRANLLADLERKNEELERTNEELAKAKERAERESMFKSRFLANVSHEFRTPLTAIIGFSQLLTKETFGRLAPRQKEYAQHIFDSGRHLLELVNDVLDLTKVEAGRMTLQLESTQLAGLVDAVRAVLQPLADKRSIHLEFGVSPALPPLWVDPVRTRQVLFNLLSNGVKFTPQGGSVRLTAEVFGSRMVIAVRDTGIGIRAEDLPRLFREFERIEATAELRTEGTGLGLALTRRIVELHGGSIDVTSAPGVGSTFTVALPLRADGAKA